MKLRPFISWIMAWSFLVMTWTGIMLFIVPKGRVANWVQWEFMGLSKDDYTALHVIFMVVFVLGSIVHIVLNWKALVQYLKNRPRSPKTGPKILVSTFAISLFIAWATLANIAPFSSFLEWQEDIKVSWEDPKTEAPYGHAELSTLNTLASRMGWDKDKTKAAFSELGFTLASPQDTLNDLAKTNKTTPQAIYVALASKLKSTSTSTSASPTRSGLGRLSLSQAAKQEGFDLEGAINALHVKGVNATQDSTLKPLAESLGITPGELIEILKK
jgi:hypothetical protein